MKNQWKASFGQQTNQNPLNKSFLAEIIKKNDSENKQVDIERKKMFGNNTKTDIFNIDSTSKMPTVQIFELIKN